MSIATLKRKTETKYNSMSCGVPAFSLNGPHRSQGWVGQTMLSRSLPITHMKGITPKGNGGCCGKYPIRPIIQSAVTTQDDSHVVKSSSLTTKGMIDTKYRWIRRGEPYATVKPDVNVNLTNGSDYTEFRRKRSIFNTQSTIITDPEQQTIRTYKELPRQARPRVSRLTNVCPVPIVKPEYYSLGLYPNNQCKGVGVAKEAGMYIFERNVQCSGNDTLQQQRSGCHVPFGKVALGATTTD